jgi:hypothetical protein
MTQLPEVHTRRYSLRIQLVDSHRQLALQHLVPHLVVQAKRGGSGSRSEADVAIIGSALIQAQREGRLAGYLETLRTELVG